MATVVPFRAFHYNPEPFSDLTPVITPPYDNIPLGDETKYLNRSPYNFAHLDLPTKPQDDYTGASKRLEEWFAHGIFKETANPCYFLYEQHFAAEGKTFRRRTLMAAVLLQDFSEGIIRPHENTHGKYKADRLQLLRSTRVNLSQIFAMVKDEEQFLDQIYDRAAFEPVFLKGTSDDGCRHTLWKMEGDKGLTSFFANRPLYIVDGHHRYESSVQYAREVNALGDTNHPAAYGLFAIANTFDPALVVYPTHRLVKPGFSSGLNLEKLQATFTLKPMAFEELEKLVSTPVQTPQFGLFAFGKLFHCQPKQWQSQNAEWGPSVARLSVAWSDNKILKEMCDIGEQERAAKLFYERDLKAAWDARNAYDLVVFQPRPAISEVTTVADEKRYMPQKSTYFFPKLAAGVVMRKLSL